MRKKIRGFLFFMVFAVMALLAIPICLLLGTLSAAGALMEKLIGKLE